MRGERREHNCQRLKDLTLVALETGQFIQGDHKRADRRVVGEVLDVVLLLGDQLMEDLQLGRSGLLVGHDEVVTIVEEPPELAQESVHAIDTLCVPRL